MSNKRKIKLLVSNEASFLETGFSKIGREMMKILHETDCYDIIEIGSYGHEDDPRCNDYPWKIYPVIPHKESQAYKVYQSQINIAQFGALKFNSVAVIEKPDIVCMPPDSIIATENGYKEICEVNKDDFVLTHTGEYKKVKKRMRRQNIDELLYNIYVNGDSMPLKLTSEHPILVYRKKDQTNKKKSIAKIYDGVIPEFVPASQVRAGDLAVFPRNKEIKYKTIEITDYLVNFVKNGKYIQQARHSKSIHNINNKIKLTYDFGRLCGYIIGNGCLCNKTITITFNGDKKEFAEDSVKLFKKIFNVKSTYKKDKDKHAFTVYCCSVLLTQFFTKFLGYKARGKFIPKEIRFAWNNVKRGIICGLIRTDGCYKKNTVSYSTVNKSLAYEYRQLCIDLNIPVNINSKVYDKKDQNNKTIYNIEGYGESAEKLSKIANKFNNKITNKILEIKPSNQIIRRGRTTQIINGHMVASVKRIRKSKYRGMVYNIAVEDNESYVSNWCLHNCDIRDFWMIEHIFQSPYRDFYKFVIRPPVDSAPQRQKWINNFKKADIVFSHSKWGKKILEESNIKVDGVLPGGINIKNFKKTDKIFTRRKYLLSDDLKVILSVMRNQPRKQIPELLEGYALFKQRYPDSFNHSVLLLHTSFPDVGWEIDELLDRFGLNGDVLFTNICMECKKPSVTTMQSHYRLNKKNVCLHCGKSACVFPNTANGVSEQQLNQIYNLADVYVQMAGGEGWGMPMCFIKNTLITTSCGEYKEINEIIKNDCVFGKDQEKLNVTDTFERKYTGKLYNIKSSGNIDASCTPEHPFFVNKNNSRDIKDYEFVEAKDLRAGYTIATPVLKVKPIAKKIDLSKYNIKYSKFSNHDSGPYKVPKYIKIDEDFAYLLGVYIGDGSCNQQKYITTVEISGHATKKYKRDKKIKKIIEKIFLRKVNRTSKKNTSRLRFNMKNVHNLFYDLCGRKYLSKKIPIQYIGTNTKLTISLLRGLFDSDGCYNNYSYSTSSRVLAVQVQNLLASNNILSFISFCNRKNKKHLNIEYNIIVEKKHYEKFENFINIKPIAKSRNKTKRVSYFYKEIKDNYMYTVIKTIKTKKVKDIKVYNIDTDGSSTYIANNMLVHNCEAKAAGLPVMACSYSAMADHVTYDPGGIEIGIKGFFYDHPSMQKRVLPDLDDFAKKLDDFFKMPVDKRRELGDAGQKYVVNNYTYEKITKTFHDIIMGIELLDRKKTWDSPIKKMTNYKKVSPEGLSTMTNYEFAHHMYKFILEREPDPDGAFGEFLNYLNIGRITRDGLVNQLISTAQQINKIETLRCQGEVIVDEEKSSDSTINNELLGHETIKLI